MVKESEIKKVLSEVSKEVFDGKLVRYVHLRSYEAKAPRELLFDRGSLARGTRFTSINGAAVLYFSVGRDCAWAEYNRQNFQELREGKRISSTVQLIAQVKLCGVLNLSDPKVRSHLETNLQEIQSEWRGHFEFYQKYPLTWVLGQAVFDSKRFDAIRYPSQWSKGDCIAILTERLGMEDYVEADPGVELGPSMMKGSLVLRP